MRDYRNRRVTPPKRVTSLTWGPPPTWKPALKLFIHKLYMRVSYLQHRIEASVRFPSGGSTFSFLRFSRYITIQLSSVI